MNSKIFIQGAIPGEFIATSIAKHQRKTTIGAHNIFLGQVRADQIEGREVIGIDYETYQDMAERIIQEIREYAIQKYQLTCLHIFHSIGKVRTGEICFFVMASSKSRAQVYAATEDVVDKVKEGVPIFGKEWVGEEDYYWKQNI